MSDPAIRAALEGRLNSLSPALATAWENAAYTPVIGTPYQRVHLLPARTRAAAAGTTAPRFESGIFQVSLYYPANAGPGPAEARAVLLRQHFPRGLSLPQSGILVRIEDDASLAPAIDEPDWRQLPVSIPYFAHV